MDAILSRAGLSAAQQRALCLDTIRGEVQDTRTKLEDALVSLRRLEEVVRLAKSVDKSQTPLNTLAPDVQAPLAAMASVGIQIGPLLNKVKADMSASSEFELEEPSTTQANNESVPTTETNPTTEIRSTVLSTSASRPIEPSPESYLRDSTEASAPCDQSRSSSSVTHKRGPSTSAMEEHEPSSNSFLRPAQSPSTGDTTDVDIKLEVAGGRPSKRRALERQSHTSREALNVTESLESRQLQIPAEEQEGVFYKCLTSTIAIVGHDGETKRVQLAVDNTRAAIQDFFRGFSSFSSECLNRLEDIRLILSVVVRAVLKNSGKLDDTGLRDLYGLIGKLLQKYPGLGGVAVGGTRSCTDISRKTTTNRRIQLSLSKPKWCHYSKKSDSGEPLKTLTSLMIDRAMKVVGKTLGDPFDGWKPREDSRLAELIGLLKICVYSSRDSLVQRRRLGDIDAWLDEMSGCSFKPTLGLSSLPPTIPREVFIWPNRRFKSLDDVKDGLERIAEAREENDSRLLTVALHSFLVNAFLTDRKFLPLSQLRIFNQSVEDLGRID